MGTGVSFLGNGFPGAFTAAAFLTGLTDLTGLTGLTGAFFTGLAGAFFITFFTAFFTGLAGAFLAGLLPFTAFLAGLAGLVGLRCLFVPMAAQVSPVEVNEPLLAFRLARLPLDAGTH